MILSGHIHRYPVRKIPVICKYCSTEHTARKRAKPFLPVQKRFLPFVNLFSAGGNRSAEGNNPFSFGADSNCADFKFRAVDQVFFDQHTDNPFPILFPDQDRPSFVFRRHVEDVYEKDVRERHFEADMFSLEYFTDLENILCFPFRADTFPVMHHDNYLFSFLPAAARVLLSVFWADETHRLMCRIPSGFVDSGCYPACAAVLFHLRQANDLVFQVYSPCVWSITVLQCLTAFLLLNSSRILLAVIVLIIIQSFPDLRRNDSWFRPGHSRFPEECGVQKGRLPIRISGRIN